MHPVRTYIVKVDLVSMNKVRQVGGAIDVFFRKGMTIWNQVMRNHINMRKRKKRKRRKMRKRKKRKRRKRKKKVHSAPVMS